MAAKELKKLNEKFDIIVAEMKKSNERMSRLEDAVSSINLKFESQDVRTKKLEDAVEDINQRLAQQRTAVDNGAQDTREIIEAASKLVVTFSAGAEEEDTAAKIIQTAEPKPSSHKHFPSASGKPAKLVLTFSGPHSASSAKAKLRAARLPGTYTNNFLTKQEMELKYNVALPVARTFRNHSTYGATCDDTKVKVWEKSNPSKKKPLDISGISGDDLPTSIDDPRIRNQLKKLFPTPQPQPQQQQQRSPPSSPTAAASFVDALRRPPPTPSSTIKEQQDAQGGKRAKSDPTTSTTEAMQA